MTASNSKTILTFTDKFSFGASCWPGLLLALLCALLLPGCTSDTDSILAADPELAEEINGLESALATDRETALLHLADLGKERAEDVAAPRAVELLKDENANVRKAAMLLITRFGHKTPESVAALIAAATSDEDVDVRGEAFYGHEEFVKLCKTLLTGDDPDKRCMAANGLVGAGEHAMAAETELLAGLKDSEWCVREQCADALGKFGSKASAEVKAALKAAANDEDAKVAKAAKAALKNLGN
jgi:HEAT repeat protein